MIAGLLLAITPIAVAVDRSNNTESWLVFFLLLAAWVALRGRGPSLAISMALLGVAFNVKMLAAFVCGPALLAGWLVASSLGMAAAARLDGGSGVVLAVVSSPARWPTTSSRPASRPHVTSSSGNSMLELIVVHNGIHRFDPASLPSLGLLAHVEVVRQGAGRAHSGWPRPCWPARSAGWRRWRCSGLLAWRRRHGGPASLALWGIWALTYGIVYSVAGGIFHAYYLSTMAPPLAALAGMACVELWRRGPGWLALGLAATAAWQAYLVVDTLGWQSAWLAPPLVVLLAAAAMPWRARHAAAALAGAALFALPLAWSLSAVLLAGQPLPAVGEPATRARPERRPRARSCRVTGRRSPTIPSWSTSCSPIAAARASSPPRRPSPMPPPSSSAAASPCWRSAATTASTACCRSNSSRTWRAAARSVTPSSAASIR